MYLQYIVCNDVLISIMNKNKYSISLWISLCIFLYYRQTASRGYMNVVNPRYEQIAVYLCAHHLIAEPQGRCLWAPTAAYHSHAHGSKSLSSLFLPSLFLSARVCGLTVALVCIHSSSRATVKQRSSLLLRRLNLHADLTLEITLALWVLFYQQLHK